MISKDSLIISLDFQGIEARKALQILSKFIQLNLIVENSIQGKIGFYLSQVFTEEKLQSILHLNHLTQQSIGQNACITQAKNFMASYLSGNQKTVLETKHIIIKNRPVKEIGALFLDNQSQHE